MVNIDQQIFLGLDRELKNLFFWVATVYIEKEIIIIIKKTELKYN